MIVALVSDIHANLPALKSVIQHATTHHVQDFWDAGDSLGYGAFPNQVVKRLRKGNILSILGNYDEKVLRFPEKQAAWSGTKMPEKILAFSWAYRQLSDKNRRYLETLPSQRHFLAEGWRIMITHGSPFSAEEHLTPQTDDQRFRELAAHARADIIIFGHSHQPFSRYIDGTLFINPGSVGRPDDGDPRASYALLSLSTDRADLQFLRISYNIKQAVKRIRKHNLPEEFAQMILHGRNLDNIRALQVTEESMIETIARLKRLDS